jgi:hypothetical protein
MTWRVGLRNIDELEGANGITGEITSLNYHLHQQWTNSLASFGTGATACGEAVTGGHYDPFFACGPASGLRPPYANTNLCDAAGLLKDDYTCSSAYENKEYDRCEVGDLSGKMGALSVVDGKVREKFSNDPLPALNYQFVSDTTINEADRFASIVFHDGSPRVLCGQLKLVQE